MNIKIALLSEVDERIDDAAEQLREQQRLLQCTVRPKGGPSVAKLLFISLRMFHRLKIERNALRDEISSDRNVVRQMNRHFNDLYCE